MADNWAIVIGIDHYPAMPKVELKGAVADARRMADWLIREADVAPRNLTLMLGTTPGWTKGAPLAPSSPLLAVRELTAERNTVITAIQLALDRSGRKGDRFFFYFAGHGIYSGLHNGLMFADASDTLTDNSISLEILRDLLLATEFREQFFFLDACRNKAFANTVEIGRWPPKTDLTPADPAGSQFGMTATSPMNKSFEIDERGAFTSALLDGLAGAGAAKRWVSKQRSYVVEWSSLFDYVAATVEARELPGKSKSVQRPRDINDRGRVRPILATFPEAAFATPVSLTITLAPTDALATVAVRVKDLARFDQTIGKPVTTVPLRFDLPAREYGVIVDADGWVVEDGQAERELPLYAPETLQIQLTPQVAKQITELAARQTEVFGSLVMTGTAAASQERELLATVFSVAPPSLPQRAGAWMWGKIQPAARTGLAALLRSGIASRIKIPLGGSSMLSGGMSPINLKDLGDALLSSRPTRPLPAASSTLKPIERGEKSTDAKQGDAVHHQGGLGRRPGLRLGAGVGRQTNTGLGSAGLGGKVLLEPKRVQLRPIPYFLRAVSKDPFARVEITGDAGDLVAAGTGAATVTERMPGFYRARVIAPDAAGPERLIRVEASGVGVQEIPARAPTSRLVRQLLEMSQTAPAADRTIALAAAIPPLAAPDLAAVLALAGVNASGPEGTRAGGALAPLAVPGFAGESGLMVLAGSDLAEGWDGPLRLALDGEAFPCAQLPAFSNVLHGARALPPGRRRLRIGLPELPALDLPLAIHPGSVTIVVFAQAERGDISFTVLLAARHSVDWDSRRRALALTQAVASDTLAPDQELIAQVLQHERRDPLALALATFEALRAPASPALAEAGAALLDLAPDWPEGLVLRAELVGRDSDEAAALFATALDRPPPLLRDALTRLIAGAALVRPGDARLPALLAQAERLAHPVFAASFEQA